MGFLMINHCFDVSCKIRGALNKFLLYNFIPRRNTIIIFFAAYYTLLSLNSPYPSLQGVTIVGSLFFHILFVKVCQKLLLILL